MSDQYKCNNCGSRGKTRSLGARCDICSEGVIVRGPDSASFNDSPAPPARTRSAPRATPAPTKPPNLTPTDRSLAPWAIALGVTAILLVAGLGWMFYRVRHQVADARALAAELEQQRNQERADAAERLARAELDQAKAEQDRQALVKQKQESEQELGNQLQDITAEKDKLEKAAGELQAELGMLRESTDAAQGENKDNTETGVLDCSKSLPTAWTYQLSSFDVEKAPNLKTWLAAYRRKREKAASALAGHGIPGPVFIFYKLAKKSKRYVIMAGSFATEEIANAHLEIAESILGEGGFTRYMPAYCKEIRNVPGQDYCLCIDHDYE